MTQDFTTHQVENQPSALGDYNLWSSDTALRDAIAREGGDWAADHLAEYGAALGGALREAGEEANENRPKLLSFDRYGRRVDTVKFHPAYHQLMEAAVQHGVSGFAWRNANRAGAHVARAGLAYLGMQVDAGTGCPMSMTHSAIPALRHAPDLAEAWIPKLIAPHYDPRPLPMAEKTGCTIGMGMTEKQGGSDLRRNTTRAERQPDGSYRITGHKWFFSAPMSDAHLVLAQSDAGLSCFLIPRILPDGRRNAVEVQRLKDKLGDWSNASSEVEFLGATGHLVGTEGRGVPVIIEMVALTRLDCMIGSAAIMRQALVQALHHTAQRQAFGARLIDQPLMRNVLADLALESEAALALTMRVARAIDSAERTAHEAAFARIATAIGKFWICKRAVPMVNEAQECLGGIGYVEETIMPRLYRQAPLNSIWEGSGNVQCLDVLRALTREPQTRDALLSELTQAAGQNPTFDRQLDALPETLQDAEALEFRSRKITETLAMMLQAALLLTGDQPEIGAAFCAARLACDGHSFGTLASAAPVDLLIARAQLCS